MEPLSRLYLDRTGSRAAACPIDFLAGDFELPPADAASLDWDDSATDPLLETADAAMSDSFPGNITVEVWSPFRIIDLAMVG